MAAPTQRLALRTGQSIVLTPQLRQAIKLLELSNLELAAFVAAELEQNPLLEPDEEFEAARTRSAAPLPAADAAGDRVRRRAIPARGPAGGPNGGAVAAPVPAGAGNPVASAERDGLDQIPDRAIDLRTHLLTQLTLDIGDPIERRIGMHLVDLLDEAGYVSGDLAEIARLAGCPLAQVEATLDRVQRFDPPGIFARNLRECLALQLRDRDRLDPAMQTLLDHLELLAKGDRRGLMRLCRVDAEDLAAMIAELRTLDPKPALAFEPAAVVAVQPDILVEPAADGGWVVELNPDTLPRVLVNHAYVARLRGAAKRSDRGYLQERLNAANWLVKCLNQRAETILRVASEIVRRQDGFLRHGVHHLKPLARREIAVALGVHESTVSRAVVHKFMLTPRGLHELKYFFTSAILGREGSRSHAAEAVRARIRQLIEAERPDAILSDDGLAELLRGEGIQLARRTVAKYRESMRIPSSFRRRRSGSLRI